MKALAPTALCPYCSQRVEVPDALLSQLEGYEKVLIPALEASRAERRAAAAPRVSRAFLENLPSLTRTMQVVPIVLTIAAAAIVPNSSGGQTIVVVVMLGALSLTGVAFLYLQRKRDHAVSPPGSLTVNSVVCSSCGATQAFVATGLYHSCLSCGAVLLPTAETTSLAAGAIAATVTRERILRWRVKRESWALSPTRQGAYRPGRVLRGGAFFLMFFTLRPLSLLLDGKGSIKEAVPLLIALLLAFVFLYVEKVDGRRVAQLKAAFDSLVTEYGGVPRRTLTWLDAWWAGPITHEIAVGGWAYHALEFRRHGYNSLLVADTLALKGQQARIVILLPAWIPGVSEPQASSDSFAWLDAPRAREIHQLITSRGFDVEVVAPGIIASATRDRVDYFRRYPRRAAELAAVVIDVADLAKAIGAQSLDEALSRMREPGTPFGPEASSEQGNS